MRQASMASKEIPFKIILGSKSMARRQILADMGYDFTTMTADIDEKAIRKEKPQELVVALAEAKAGAIISRLPSAVCLEEDVNAALLITADTVVVYEGMIREKPSSKEEAREFIKGYSGGQAAVVGSVCVTNLKTGMQKVGWDQAEGWLCCMKRAIRIGDFNFGHVAIPVYFYEIPAQIIDSLIDEGVTLNVAGGLMLEHPLTLPFVKEVIGTADTVMGLSKALTEQLIQETL